VVVRIKNGVEDAPDRIPAEARSQHEEHRIAERSREDRAQRAAPVGDGATPVRRGRERESADDRVDERLRGVAQTGERDDHGAIDAAT
jgi:hypothetical protein